MGDEHHRYYKHTKLHQNPRGDLTISCWFDMEWPYIYSTRKDPNCDLILSYMAEQWWNTGESNIKWVSIG